MAVDTYYFDGSDAAASDPDSVWTNETNTDDGSITTFGHTTTAGTETTNEVFIEGTNAPASGGTITQVRARIYYEISSEGAGWGGYINVAAPTGGWTWAKVQALEAQVNKTATVVANLRVSIHTDSKGETLYANSTYASGALSSGQVDLYKVELEVTSSSGPTLATTAFRYYEDGTETGSTALAAEDTDITVDTRPGDQNLQLRVQLQESGGTAGDTTDDFQLQYSINSGSYTNVTSSSSNVKGYVSGDLTDAGTTTSRLTAGTGSFVTGEVSEDGLVDDRQITASNYTELLYSLTIIEADLDDGDTLDFQVLFNGATITNTEVPRITINEAARYKSSAISGTISSSGLSRNVIMFGDE